MELQSELDDLSMKMGVSKVEVKPLVVEGPNLAWKEPELKDVDENYLRDLLVIQKKGTERYRMVRNALIVFLATVKEMMLPNIAEEAGVSIYTIKNVMKASKNVRQ